MTAYLTAWAIVACVCSFVGVPLLIVAGAIVGRLRARRAADEAAVVAAFEVLADRADRETLALVLGLRFADEAVAPVIPIQRRPGRWS